MRRSAAAFPPSHSSCNASFKRTSTVSTSISTSLTMPQWRRSSCRLLRSHWTGWRHLMSGSRWGCRTLKGGKNDAADDNWDDDYGNETSSRGAVPSFVACCRHLLDKKWAAGSGIHLVVWVQFNIVSAALNQDLSLHTHRGQFCYRLGCRPQRERMDLNKN